MGARRVGDDLRQRRLAGAGRPVEDEAAQLVGLDGAAQQPPRPDDVLLADVLVQRARAHARGQRRVAVPCVRAWACSKRSMVRHYEVGRSCRLQVGADGAVIGNAIGFGPDRTMRDCRRQRPGWQR